MSVFKTIECNASINNETSKRNNKSNIEKISEDLFGKMREPIPEEQNNISNHIKRTSKLANTNFWENF